MSDDDTAKRAPGGRLPASPHARVHARPRPDTSGPSSPDESSSEYLRCLLRTIPDLVWLKAPDGRYLMCNSVFESFIGARERDIVGRDDFDFFDRDLAEFFRANDRLAMERDRPSSNEERLVFAETGYEGIFETIKTPMRDASGRLLGILGIARDITDRKRTEEALEKRMISLTRPLDNAPDIRFEELFNLEDIQRLQDEFAVATGMASLITRPDGAPLTRPSSFRKLCELIRSTPEGRANCFKSDAEIGRFCTHGPTLRPCLSAGLWDAGAAIMVGGQHVANWLVGQVRDPERNEASLRAYAHEIGLSEEALVEAYREVPLMSRERFGMVAQMLFTLANQLSTAAYQNVQQARFIFERRRVEEELIRLKDRAEAANRAKSEFLANMSHEIRTPLNGVLGMLHLLGDAAPTKEQRQLLEAATSSASRLTGLLSDILDLSKVEAGKLRIVNRPFRLDGLRDAILELFSLAARENKDKLEFLLDRDVPPVLVGDEARLRQVLFNLVGNAVKFTERGDIRVEISCLPAPQPDRAGGVRLLFLVADTGIGISDEQLAAVFEPFVQADGSSTRRFQGAGLGLAIVRKLVRLMGGGLALESNEGVGTTAYLSLPFRLPESETSAAGAKTPLLGRQSHSGLRILLVEDDHVNRLFGKKMLEKQGYVVHTANNGRQALDALARESFDLIVMDIQMPVMNGLEATAAIRASRDIGANARIPIIAMTAHAMSGDRDRFLAAGMNGYVSKPVDMEALRKVLGELADGGFETIRNTPGKD